MSRKWTPLREFNQCHNPKGEAGGKFCSDPKGGGDDGGSVKDSAPQYGDSGSGGATAGTADVAQYGGEGDEGAYSSTVDPAAAAKREPPIYVDTIEEAADLLIAGHNVEVSDTKDVNTLLRGLAAMAQDAAAKGKEAPNYDLCKVSVQGTNLFCTDRMRTAEHPEGVERWLMPQIGGEPVAGTDADKLPKKFDDRGKASVDATEAYIAHLRSQGIEVSEITSVPAASLKATQAELVGPQVAGMMTNPDYDPAGAPIFVSRDKYVVDGHHRWAAQVGRDAGDGRLGQSTMKVYKIDAPIAEVIKVSQAWSKQFGIKGKKAGAARAKTKLPTVRLRPTSNRSAMGFG